MTSESPKRGICGVCRREMTLTKTGKMWPHSNGITSIVDPRRGQRCAGAGKPPAQGQR
ncbi:hypothetical protein V2E29_04640 [Streptomyces diastatochromogenes]|uniref:hypothetical protein n=1 Tax=Streptomyces diastatochromogenes TaxID=42236 RepID=UPI002F260F0A